MKKDNDVSYFDIDSSYSRGGQHRNLHYDKANLEYIRQAGMIEKTEVTLPDGSLSNYGEGQKMVLLYS